MSDMALLQFETQLSSFSDSELKHIAKKIKQLLSHPKKQDPFFSESNMQAIDKSLEELKAGKVVVKSFDELEALER